MPKSGDYEFPTHLSWRDGFSVPMRYTTDEPVISYIDAGPSTPEAIVLLHSLGTDQRMWRAQIDQLSSTWRVIAVAARGHGASQRGFPASLDNWTADMARVLDHAQIDRATLVGISLGGQQALSYAAAQPDRVAGVVAADCFAELEPATAERKINELVGLAEGEGMAVLADAYVEQTFRPPYPPAVEDVRAAIAQMSVHDYSMAARTCFGAQIGDQLALVEAPTLVLWGEHDEKTPRALSERISAGVAGAVLREVRAAGHLSNVDNSEHFTSLVADFVKSLGRHS